MLLLLFVVGPKQIIGDRTSDPIYGVIPWSAPGLGPCSTYSCRDAAVEGTATDR